MAIQGVTGSSVTCYSRLKYKSNYFLHWLDMREIWWEIIQSLLRQDFFSLKLTAQVSLESFFPFKTDFKKDLFTETASPDISVSLRIIYPIVLLHFLNYGHFNIFSDLIFFFFFFPKPCSSAPSWIYLFLEMFHTYQAEGNLLSFHSCENRL